IISVGELHHIKGYDRMLNILKEVLYDLKTSNLPIDFHYHIVGDGSERYNLIELQKQLSLDNRITFHGHVKDAFKIIKDFDIFIMPSRSEALAFALLEAYNAGTEIIASNVGGLTEVVENANHGTLLDFENIFEARNVIVSKITSIYINRIKGMYEKPSPMIIFPLQKMLRETESVYNK
ncbi:MAG: glycosyltransferase, partial [Candidatus Pacebacteria bacterium]|nr:glycosyltransferase [Candidatus Paceibacterota bacterium]